MSVVNTPSMIPVATLPQPQFPATPQIPPASTNGDIRVRDLDHVESNMKHRLKNIQQELDIRLNEMSQRLLKLAEPPSAGQWALQSLTSLCQGIVATMPLMMILHNNTHGLKDLVARVGESVQKLAGEVAKSVAG